MAANEIWQAGGQNFYSDEFFRLDVPWPWDIIRNKAVLI
jgi:hypothetical protein